MSSWPGQITNTQLGPRYVWHNSQCTWISIPKNANMMFRKFCEHIGMYKVELTKPAPISVAVIRNPKIRLVSAVCEYLRRTQSSIIERHIHSSLCRFYCDPTLFDEHLEPQTMWLQNVPVSHYIRFETMLEDIHNVPYMNQFTNHFFKMVDPNKLTKSRRYIDLHGFVNKYSNLLDECVEKFYLEDLTLYNKLNNNRMCVVAY